MEPSTASTTALQDTDDYLFLDPKSPRSTIGAKPKRMVFSEATVFLLGGGSYVEYTNLLEWTTRVAGSTSLPAKKITYGSTEIMDPEEFLQVLAELA